VISLQSLSLAVTIAAFPSLLIGAAAPAELGSTFIDLDTLSARPTPVGVFHPVVDAPTPTLERLELHVTTLNPGFSSHPPHHHPQEELVLIQDGTLESSINRHQQRVGPGSLLFFASHDVHNVRNIGDRPATYYVINFYTAATGTVRNQPAAEWAPADKLRSSVIDWDKLVPKPTAADTRRALVNSPTLTFANLEIHATTVNPGGPATRPHRHPWLMLIIIKDGAMEATIDGVSHVAGAGSIVYMAPNALQSMRNPGHVPSTYFVFSVSSAETARTPD
jgi:quercetin dioxygenase-like cupin family protein